MRNHPPTLSVCPALIPDRLGRKFTFLESVLVARRKLEELPTVREFLEELLSWAGRGANKSDRYLQNVLDAYYVVGVIPKTTLTTSFERRLACTLPPRIDLQEIRLYCLNCLTNRVTNMPEFWRVASSRGNFDTQGICQAVAITHDDGKRRIRLLRNLGALQKSGNEYSLSPLGIRFRASLGIEVDHAIPSQELRLKESHPENDAFVGFIDW